MISLLHVDRDENYLRSAKQYLENHGDFQIHSVTSARDALEILKTETFDAIVADCMVPDPAGIAFLDTLRSQENTTPFIIHTATTRGSVVIDAVNHGASFYLVKGKKPDQVFARLQTAVEKAVARHRVDKEIRQIAKIPEQNPGPVMRISGGGVLVYANPASADLLVKWGMKIGMAVTPGISITIRNVLHNQSEAVIEETVGSIVYLLTFSPVAGEDSVNIYGKNITERKRAQSELERSEARLNEAQHLAQIGSWRWDISSDTISWSDELYAIYGRDPAVPLPGHAGRLKMFTPESAERLEHAIHHAIKTRNPYEIEVELIRGDGEHRWVIARGVAVRDKDGRVQALTGTVQDITGHKRAEEAIRRANAYNRSLIEGALDPLVTIAPDGTISDVNNATILATGFSREELIGTDFSRYFTEPDRAKDGYEKVFQEGSVKDYELEICHRNGQVMPVLYNATVFRDEKGNITGVFAAARDITDRKRAEDVIRRANDYNRGLIEASPDPLITIAEDGTINDANNATVKVTGFSREELIGTDFSRYFTEPDRAKAGYEKVFREGTVKDYELQIRHRNGQVTPVLYNATVFRDDSGNIAGVFAAARDITEHKQAEALLRRFNIELENGIREKTQELAESNKALREEIAQRKLAEVTARKTLSLLNATLESTADGIYVVDRSGKITGYNQHFVSMWNIPDPVLGSRDDHTVTDFLMTQLKNPVGALARVQDLNMHAERESFDMLEFSDGRVFERYSKPQKIGKAVVGRVWSFRDITDRKHAEDGLVAALDEKEVLLREIHHRVKNNLQLISGLLDMTRMRTEDGATNSILTDMMMKIQTMAQIHTRLYESKQFDRINVGNQIRDQIAALSNIYSHKDREITCDVQFSDIYLPVDQAIPFALVINEILSNAYKHAFKGRRRGSITISLVQNDGNIRAAVRDDGIGIPMDIDASRTNSLGLKLVRNLIEHQLKGSFEIKRNNGSEVIVEFPLAAMEV